MINTLEEAQEILDEIIIEPFYKGGRSPSEGEMESIYGEWVELAEDVAMIIPSLRYESDQAELREKLARTFLDGLGELLVHISDLMRGVCEDGYFDGLFLSLDDPKREPAKFQSESEEDDQIARFKREFLEIDGDKQSLERAIATLHYLDTLQRIIYYEWMGVEPDLWITKKRTLGESCG